MRQVFRELLPTDSSAFLQECEARGEDWKSARAHARFKPVLKQLQHMCGLHQRCMYCVDSAATDVEHFKPKGAGLYPEATFEWLNMLLACTTCNNKHKGIKFPLDANQQPLLVDPSVENPWDYLTYEPESGYIKALYDLSLDSVSPKGLETVEILGLDSREVLQTGYKKTYRRLVEVMGQIMDLNDQIFVTKLIETDDHGLLGWCFSRQGKRQAPFDRLTNKHHAIWTNLTT